jgi:ABC-type oligopeptide transport system ATPase subunit
MNPEVNKADEPVSALDVSIQAQVVNLLLDLKERLGLTIIFIAHDLSLVRYFCDRIAVMRLGKILELAPSKELFSAPLHPYTKSLLSAIPYPDPTYEKTRKRIFYEPTDYENEQPLMREIKKDRWVYATEKEAMEYKKSLKRLKGKNENND